MKQLSIGGNIDLCHGKHWHAWLLPMKNFPAKRVATQFAIQRKLKFNVGATSAEFRACASSEVRYSHTWYPNILAMEPFVIIHWVASIVFGESMCITDSWAHDVLYQVRYVQHVHETFLVFSPREPHGWTRFRGCGSVDSHSLRKCARVANFIHPSIISSIDDSTSTTLSRLVVESSLEAKRSQGIFFPNNHFSQFQVAYHHHDANCSRCQGLCLCQGVLS